MRKKTYSKLMIFLIVLLIVGAFIFGYLLSGAKIPFFEKKVNWNTDTEQNIVNNCKNLDILNTAICLRDNIKSFYNYSLSGDEIRTFEQLKTIGGDCKSYAYLYESLGNQLGFYSTTVSVYTAEYKRHRFAIISNDKAYCILDQLNYGCVGLGK